MLGSSLSTSRAGPSSSRVSGRTFSARLTWTADPAVAAPLPALSLHAPTITARTHAANNRRMVKLILMTPLLP